MFADCPPHFVPIAQRLIEIAAGHAGKFVLCGFGEDPQTNTTLPSQIMHLPNEGDPALLVSQFGSAIGRFSKMPGLNTYIMPALVRADLPEGSRGKESDLTGVLAVVLDFDGKHDPATRHHRLPVEPHAEVETSPGNIQCWYFLDKPYPVAEVKPIIAALVAQAGSDLGCKSADHPFRIPGTLNWPNATKRARGRPAEPVMAQLTDWNEEVLFPNYSLDELKASILTKCPTAFDAQTAVATANKDFDWDQRCAALTPMNEVDCVKILNDPKYDRDRSEGAWAFSCAAMRRGHSPDEVVELMLDHADTLCMGHYGDQPDKARIRADVRRAFIKEKPKLPSGTFELINLGGAANAFGLGPLEKFHADETDLDAWFARVNQEFAVSVYGSKTVIARFGDKLEFFDVLEFDRMYAPRRVKVPSAKGETKRIPLTKAWFNWEGRREYLNPGVLFAPGAEDRPGMLNLWRGFGVEPKAGHWSRMRAHIYDGVCSGNMKNFDYLMKWMAHGVQHPGQQIGIAVALRGAQGAGKGILFRTYGNFFGQHFIHLSQGSQLTGRFNASLGAACAVFLDEALWAGDRQGEGTLKALVTEPTFQLERKFCDPITVPNRLRIMIASNSDWFVPVGVGDRRYFVLDVADTYAGIGHTDYWDALYDELDSGGREAMLYDLLAMDLSNYDVRAVPDTVAKTEQKLHSLRGTRAWLAHVLQESEIGIRTWEDDGLGIEKEEAYRHYGDFSKARREWSTEIKEVWAKTLRKALGHCLEETRSRDGSSRRRTLTFGPLAKCRATFEKFIGADADAMVWRQEE